MKTSRSTTQENSEAESHVQTTAGEVFADGSAIELVTTDWSNGDGLGLLFWHGEKASLLPQVHYLGRRYLPIQVHSSLHRAMRLPRRAVDYGSPGELFAGAANLFERYIGFSKPEAALVASWIATTYFPDFMLSPPPLLVSGPDMDQGIRFFLLLHSLCRHPLLLAGVSRSAIRSLPMYLRPTLLINEPDLPSPVWALWRASNYRGLFVPGNGGTVLDIACSKAVYSGMKGVPDSWSDAAVHLALPPARRELPRLDERELEDIANRFQPRLLMYRLHNFQKVRQSNCSRARPLSGEIGRSLAVCIEGGPDVAKAAALLLRRQEQDALAQRGCDVNVVLVKVLWLPSHEEKEIAITRAAALANALLRDQCEPLEYSAAEIGWRLRNLGFCRYRNGRGMVLRFSRENRARIHQLARRVGLTLPALAGCQDCALPEVAATQ